MQIVILGLSITSSWGNGHATTYRALVRALSERGHNVLFLERDVPWYAGARDLPEPRYGRTVLYGSIAELQARFTRAIREADLVMVGSYVPEGIAVGEWVTTIAEGVTSFYDIDTPVTLDGLENGRVEYLSRELIPRYDLYLSFTGGPILNRLCERYGARLARPLYCSVDPLAYYPEAVPERWELGYLGTFSADREDARERLLGQPARLLSDRRFVVAGPKYPARVSWPANVERIEHVPPSDHRAFYNAQRFTLNITRTAMAEAGYSPSVRLFEAAACGSTIVTDQWTGLEDFFAPDAEVLVASDTADVVGFLRNVPESDRRAIGARARERVLSCHTALHRAAELESYAALAAAQRGSGVGF